MQQETHIIRHSRWDHEAHFYKLSRRFGCWLKFEHRNSWNPQRNFIITILRDSCHHPASVTWASAFTVIWHKVTTQMLWVIWDSITSIGYLCFISWNFPYSMQTANQPPLHWTHSPYFLLGRKSHLQCPLTSSKTFFSFTVTAIKGMTLLLISRSHIYTRGECVLVNAFKKKFRNIERKENMNSPVVLLLINV